MNLGDAGTILLLAAGAAIGFSITKQAQISAVMTGPPQPWGYECFDQREDNILVHCCRHKTKPPEEPHCKSTLETGEYLKCCRDDKKAWGGLW